MLVLGLFGLCAVMYLRLSADSLSTQFVNGKLGQVLQHSALNGSVGKVNFKPGAGFEISDVRINRRDSRDELLHIDQLVVTMPTGAKELAQLDFEPTMIEIRRATIRFDRADFTGGSLQQLLRGVRFPSGATNAVPVRIRDSNIVLTDGDQRITRFSNVSIDITPIDRGTRIGVKAIAVGDHLNSVTLSATIHPESQNFAISELAAKGVVGKSLLEVLPVDLRYQGQPIVGPGTSFNGNWQISGSAAGNLNDVAGAEFGANITLDRINLIDDSLPAIIRDCHCQIGISNNAVSIRRATGRLDDGRFDISYQQSGMSTRQQWRLTGSCNELRYSRKWLGVFPDSIRKFCRDYDPAGLFDVQFTLDSNGGKQVTAQLKDTSFSYERFPYRLKNCIGDVKWIGNRLKYEIQTLEHGQLLEIGGHIDNPGEFATYVCNFGTNGRLPIDEPLFRSLINYPAMDRAVRDFRPLGRVSGTGTIEKLTPGPMGKVQKRMLIQLHDCDVRHRSFDYPIQKVNGTIRVVDDQFRFEDVIGESSSGRVVCNGDWNSKDGLRLVFLCSNVAFDSRLRHALASHLKSVWDSLRPAGEIHLGKVFLNYPPGTSAPDIRVHATLGKSSNGQNTSTVSIRPTWFPYEIKELKGDFTVGGGLISMNRVQGKHGGAWMTCAGEGSYNEQRWSVRLTNLLAGSVKFDDELMTALPPDLALAIDHLQFDGNVIVGGEIEFGAYYDEYSGESGSDVRSSDAPVQSVGYDAVADNVRIDWNLRLDMDQASMVVGLPVENIFGSLFLNGTYNGQLAKTAGRLAIDSATIYGAQITNIAGPIWIDNKQTLAGRFAEQQGKKPASITGTAFDGTVNFDGWLSHEDSLPFFVQATAEDSQLEDAAAEIAPHLQEMSGDAFGFIRLRGNAEELHTYNGEGNIHLRNARIHQLPVILALLKILQIKEINRTAFDSSDVDFSIKGDQIELSQIKLIGDAISLIGNGYLEWMRYADVNFYSVLGRNRFHIPVLSDLYKAGCQRTLWINVGGPIDNLQTSRKVLPGLNDSIKALFQSSQTANSISETDTLHR